VNFAPNGNTIICTVEDNGVGRGAAAGIPGRTSLGLKLTGERLGLLTERLKGEGGFVTEDLTDASGLPAGTRVRLTL
jgi:two-component sensor histidine kinase